MEAKIFKLTTSETPVLPLHSRVYSFGGGMSEGVWAIIDNDLNMVKMSTLYPDDYFSNPFIKLSSPTKPLSKKFGIGFYHDDINPDFRFTETEVLQAIQKAKQFIIDCQKAKESRQAQDQTEREQLILNNPHLLHNPQDEPAITKKNLLADLKKHFPNIKFSVRKEHYNTYNVSWINGVAKSKICEVTQKFESYASSSCGDFRDYEPSNFNKVFGGFKYVFEHRDFCPKIQEFLNSFNFDAYTDEARRVANLIHEANIPESFESVLFVDNKLIFEVAENNQPKPISNGDIHIIDYSTKAIAVIGNTKPLKDVLRELGGRFNFRLSCGPGWIFPATKKNEILTILNL